MSAAETISLDPEVRTATLRPAPSRRIKAAYALGQAAYSGGFEAALGLVFFYYTAVLGLSGGAVGLALAASLAVDAVFDPLIGSFSDGIRSRLGRRLPLMIVAIPFIAVSMALMFAPPAHAGSGALFAWLTVTATAVRCSISVFQVPYTALGAELADGYLERSRVVAWRTMMGIASNVIVIASAFTVFFARAGGVQHPGGYPPLGLFVAAFIVVGTSLCCFSLRRYAAALPAPTERPNSMIRRLPREIAEIFANGSFRLLFASSVMFFVAIGANGALGTHVGLFVWRLDSRMLQLPTYAVLLGVFIGVPLATPLQKRFEKKAVVIVGLGMIILVWMFLALLRATGVFTPHGVGALGPIVAQSLFAGIGLGLAVIAFPSMMADAADEHEYLFGHRREGLYFAGLSFAGKAANGLGVLVGGVALDVIGFPRDAVSHPGLVLPEPLVRKLILDWGPLPAVVGAVSLAILMGYRISRVRHDDISAALEARRR